MPGQPSRFILECNFRIASIIRAKVVSLTLIVETNKSVMVMHIEESMNI